MPSHISMISLFVFLGLIYVAAFFLWFRFFYLRSFRTAEKRGYFLERLLDLVPVVPMGLQAAFLFCFAFAYLPLAGRQLSGLFGRLVLDGHSGKYPDFSSLQIIFSGCLLLTLNYILLRAAASISNRFIAGLLKGALFFISLILLRNLVENIDVAITTGINTRPLVNYGNPIGWIPILLIILPFLYVHVSARHTASLAKYLALASRVLFFYCVLALLIDLPRIIILLIEAR